VNPEGPVRRFGPISALKFLYHLPNFARLYWRLWKDKRVSWFARSVLVLALMYVISPLDAIMDWIPFLGELDDLAVVILAFRMFIWLCPKDVVREHVASIDMGT
jgi:uncharacterized membrane protein YkvA (DUF1232 family)